MNENNPGTDNSANTTGTTGSNGNGSETRNFSGQWVHHSPAARRNLPSAATTSWPASATD